MFVTRKDQHSAVLDGPQQEMERCVLEPCVKKADVEEVYAEAPTFACAWMAAQHHHAPLKNPTIVNAL
jgi:hypothetical protein